MKVFTFEASFQEAHNIKEETPLTIYPEAHVRILPDTALQSGGRPFFVPDGEGPVAGYAAWGVRVSRLGRHIPERFAHRYYDAATVGVCFVDEGLRKRLRAQAGGSDLLAYGFDGAVNIGAWRALPDGDVLQWRISAGDDDRTRAFTIEEWRKKTDRAIAILSRYATLRQGDILLAKTGEWQAAEENCHIAGWLQEERILDFNVK